NERAQAQSVAADIETLLARGGVAPESVCVLVRSVRREGQAIAVALEERAVAHRLVGAAAFFQRAEIRDVLAWLRLLADPGDAGLREEEATGSGEIRGVRVMAMHEAKGLEFEHVYVLGLQSARMPGARRRALEPIPDALLHEAVPPDSRDVHVAEMRRLLALAMTRARRRLVLAYAANSDRGAEQPPSPFVEEARAAVGATWEDREEELFGPAETLHATFRLLREELLETVSRTASRLGELRFDTDLDVSHAVVRYLELIKLAALIERPAGQSVEDALPEINARLGRAVTAEQREILQTSALDEYVLDAERSELRRAAAVAARDEPSLEAFLPRRGDGLVLS